VWHSRDRSGMKADAKNNYNQQEEWPFALRCRCSKCFSLEFSLKLRTHAARDSLSTNPLQMRHQTTL